MKRPHHQRFASFCFLLLLSAAAWPDDTPVFHERFTDKPLVGWTWLREAPEAWRIGKSGLELRVMPGNMWGGANDAKNVLIRPLPQAPDKSITATTIVENKPVEQYEQVDLVCYYADSHMVKIGQELVDGQLSVVMGREEKDRTRTIAIIPLKTSRVGLRFRVRGDQLEGFYQPDGDLEWHKAGECDLPKLEGVPAQVSLQVYQGPAADERWATIREVRVEVSSNE